MFWRTRNLSAAIVTAPQMPTPTMTPQPHRRRRPRRRHHQIHTTDTYYYNMAMWVRICGPRGMSVAAKCMQIAVWRVPRYLRKRRKATAKIRRLVARCATLSDCIMALRGSEPRGTCFSDVFQCCEAEGPRDNIQDTS